MNVWIADEELAARLRGIVEPYEIRDADGKVLGQYTPFVPPEITAAYERAKSLFDPAELRRRKEEGGRSYTTEEVLQYLKSLEQRG